MFSLYGLYNFSAKLFGECILSYGKTRVKNYEGRLISVGANMTSLKTAVGRYKSTYFGGKLLGGYNYQASDKIIITPVAGLRYSRFKDGGYKETGTSF
ncbi:MAG: autotransporter outer membrane beta-barrel domain-containing protein [Candidatus Rickettsia vulgarisii]